MEYKFSNLNKTITVEKRETRAELISSVGSEKLVMLESKEASYVLGIIIGVAFVIIVIILANIYKHWKRIAKKA